MNTLRDCIDATIEYWVEEAAIVCNEIQTVDIRVSERLCI
ncbi:protein of unknown function [Candidatus Filomicrobium marinum]|uniref:Uncharacterized protein n=1 Tax=Candidatus Filomicrobium marinum TaxID=1608628 RepID=A0A0D6JFS8_9HYPH|nr:protein of unknown function [Candidatus Filomicrobium marinum]CPR19066.1 protein of unknown function [Candidatus Filomicrobium marinum]